MRALLSALLPGIVAAALLGALLLLLEHGRALGLGEEALRWIGVAAFAVLVAAPLAVYPAAWAHGARPALRIAAAFLPALLWWCGEVAFRARAHDLGEALWLALSPVNLLHVQALALFTMLAEIGCRTAARLRGRALRVFPRRVVWTLVATVLVLANPLVAVASIPVFLAGYHAFFQEDLLPLPERLPGPLPEGTVARVGETGAPPPNLVFILSDDHRYDMAGFAGHPFVRTPSLDRLAAEGVVFTRAFVTSSLCSPSRASFLTGTWPHRHGVFNNFTPWSDENRTFLEYLGRAGYRTAFIGKWHMPGRLPELRGVDHFVTFTNQGGQGSYEWCPLVVDGEEQPSRRRYLAEELTDRAIAWIEGQRGDAPFALVLAHKNVHSPFTPDEPERSAYADAPVTLPPGAHPWSHWTDAQYTHLIPWPLGDAVRRYAAAVTSMDRQIGRLLDALDRLGLAERTAVVYTSDNGYLWGEHGLVDKRWSYEESIRVPLVVRHPGVAAAGRAEGAGRTVERLVLNVDVAPTFLELAGLAVPERMQGRSLLPLLRDADAAWRDAFYYAYWFEPPFPVPTQHTLRTERYKYVEQEGSPPSLFDLETDPRERNDLLSDGADPAVLAELRVRLAALRAAVEKPAAPERVEPASR